MIILYIATGTRGVRDYFRGRQGAGAGGRVNIAGVSGAARATRRARLPRKPRFKATAVEQAKKRQDAKKVRVQLAQVTGTPKRSRRRVRIKGR